MAKDIKDAKTRGEKKELISTKIARFRSQLEWVCDALIPSDPDLAMPSALEAGVLDEYLPRVLLARDDMADMFFEYLQSLSSMKPADAIDRLAGLGEGFDSVSRLIAGAYFLDKDVNDKLGYPGQEEITENHDYDVIMSAIEPVLARGRCYTEVPAF